MKEKIILFFKQRKQLKEDFLEWRKEKQRGIEIDKNLELEEREKIALSSLDKAILDKLGIMAYNRIAKELIEGEVSDEWVRWFIQWNKFFKSHFRKYLEPNK